MPSAKQIAWRKKFAKLYGKKKKGTKSTKFDEKAWRRKVEERRMETEKWSKEHFKGKSDADLKRIIRQKSQRGGNTDDEGAELGRRKKKT